MPKSSPCHQSCTPLRPWEFFVRIGTPAWAGQRSEPGAGAAPSRSQAEARPRSRPTARIYIDRGSKTQDRNTPFAGFAADMNISMVAFSCTRSVLASAKGRIAGALQIEQLNGEH